MKSCFPKKVYREIVFCVRVIDTISRLILLFSLKGKVVGKFHIIKANSFRFYTVDDIV